MKLNPLLVCLPGAEHLAPGLATGLQCDLADMTFRRFPDGEGYLRFHNDPMGRDLVLVAVLQDPDRHLARLQFTAAAGRAQGAGRIGLITPYLPYLRQDTAFQPGEAVTARHMGALVSSAVNWLVTLDPHLHRIDRLSRVLNIPHRSVSSAGKLAAWITARIPRPLIIGPDTESAGWVKDIAMRLAAPYLVLTKQRIGDEAVRIRPDGVRDLAKRTPVIVDDIVSTGATMCASIAALLTAGAAPPVCCVIHALFGAGVEARLLSAGADCVVTTTSIRPRPGAIDIVPPLVRGAADLLRPPIRH